MREANTILAAFFQKQPEPDADGVFHYLLQEKDSTLVVDITPHRQWTPELLKNTLMIDCNQNDMCLSWVHDGIDRTILGGPFPVETILSYDDEDEDEPGREPVLVGVHVVARIHLPPHPLSFWIISREYFYQNIYEEQSFRVLS